RPEWNDLCVVTVHGDSAAGAGAVGQIRTLAEWERLLADPSRGSTFLPLRHADGHLLGIVSLGATFDGSGRSEDELDVLGAIAEHVALAIQSAQEAAVTTNYRVGLEELLRVSSGLAGTTADDQAILQAVCEGIRDALGFQRVLAQTLDTATGALEARALVGWPDDLDTRV